MRAVSVGSAPCKTWKIWGSKREEITDTQIYSTHLLFLYIYNIKILYTFEANNRTLLHVYLKHNKIKSISQKFILQYYGDRRQRIWAFVGYEQYIQFKEQTFHVNNSILVIINRGKFKSNTWSIRIQERCFVMDTLENSQALMPREHLAKFIIIAHCWALQMGVPFIHPTPQHTNHTHRTLSPG